MSAADTEELILEDDMKVMNSAMGATCEAGGYQSQHQPEKRSRDDDDDESSSSSEDSSSDTEDPTEMNTVASVTNALSQALLSDVLTRQAANLRSSAASGEDLAPSTRVGLNAPINGNAAAASRLCSICGNSAIYTCPRCKRRTCSLTCIRLHKAQDHCSGERDVAEKVPLSEFGDAQLSKDFHFLEDCKRVVERVVAERPKEAFQYHFKALPPSLFALREAAKRRGVLLQFMSEGLKKREENASRLDRRLDTITWRCEFRFVVDPDEVLHTARSGVAARREGAKNFSMATNWGNERHRLGDILRHCTETNPSLPLFHIHRGYSNVARWLRDGDGAKDAVENEAETATAAIPSVKRLRDDNEASPPEKPAGDDATVGAGDAVGDEEQASDEADEAIEVTDEEDEDDENEDEATTEAAAAARQAEMPPPPPISRVVVVEEGDGRRTSQPSAAICDLPEERPLTAQEMILRTQAAQFLAAHGASCRLFVRAERLGDRVVFFEMNSRATLHDNLRALFFVNEFPVFYVVRAEHADQFPTVSGADRELIRSSFARKVVAKPTLEERLAALPKKADLDEDTRASYAKIPCREFVRGRCARADGECPYWHCAPSEVPACRNLVMGSHCKKGSRCSFQHDPLVIEAARAARKQQGPQSHAMRGRGRGGRGGLRGRGGDRYFTAATTRPGPDSQPDTRDHI